MLSDKVTRVEINAKRQSLRLGILFMLAGMFIYASLNAIVKDFVFDFNLVQLVFFRCVFGSVPIGILLTLRKQWMLPTRKEWKIHLLRAILCAISLSLLFFGIALLPLSDSMALYFSSTLFIVILSYPILREKVTALQWLAVVIGLVGVMVIANPTGGVFQYAAFVIIGGTFAESIYNLYARFLSTTNNTLIIVFLGNLLPACLLFFALPFVWAPLDLNHWIFLLGIGVGGGFCQLCIVFAYGHAPAGILAPMIYSSILWTIFLDVIFWGQWPSLSLIFGCGIIILAGLLIIYSESKQKVFNED